MMIVPTVVSDAEPHEKHFWIYMACINTPILMFHLKKGPIFTQTSIEIKMITFR